MIEIPLQLAWSIVVALAAVAFAAGGAWLRLGMVKDLDRDLRKHMAEETKRFIHHVEHGGHVR